MPESCAACLNVIVGPEFVKCSRDSCKQTYHKDICMNGGVLTKSNKEWICPICKCEMKKGGDNSNTPVRQLDSQNKANVTLRRRDKNIPAVPTSSVSDSSDSLSDLGLHALTSEIKLMRQDILELKDHFSSLSSALVRCHERLDEDSAHLIISDNRIKVLEDRETENQSLKNQVAQLQDQLNVQHQAALSNELEISGLPEQPNENLHHIALLLATKTGVTLVDTDIDFISRVGPRRPLAQPETPATEVMSSGPSPAWSRPIVIRLIRRAKRDEFLREAKLRKNLNAKMINDTLRDQKVYINERLTRENRLLFRETRLRATQAGFRFCFIKNGCIYVRLREKAPAIQIRNGAELDAKLGPVSINN